MGSAYVSYRVIVDHTSPIRHCDHLGVVWEHGVVAKVTGSCQ